MSLHPHPSKSSVRDPIRNSSRKHVTFKDLSAGKRALRPLAGSGPAPGTSVGNRSGPDSPGEVLPPTSHSSRSGAEASPRYTQLPNRDPAKSSLQSLRGAGGGEAVHSQRTPHLPLDGKTGTLGSPRGAAPSPQDPRAPTYVNEPYGNVQRASSPSPPPPPPSSSSSPSSTLPNFLSSSSSSSSVPRDWCRTPTRLQRDSGQSKVDGSSLSRTQPLRGSLASSSQELQTFFPAPRGRLGGRPEFPGQPHHTGKTQPQQPQGAPVQHVGRDWRNDSLATTDDGDDQRSTTTSGSYSIDNDDSSYVGVELTHAPWKDVVV